MTYDELIFTFRNFKKMGSLDLKFDSENIYQYIIAKFGTQRYNMIALACLVSYVRIIK